jgi:formylglycine-generating enzyme required for sulfatase activity
MVLVPAGTFQMGGEGTDCEDVHEVTLTRAFYLGLHEVTNREYRDALQWAYDLGHATYDAGSSLVRDAMDDPVSPATGRPLGAKSTSHHDGAFAVARGGGHPMNSMTWCAPPNALAQPAGQVSA